MIIFFDKLRAPEMYRKEQELLIYFSNVDLSSELVNRNKKIVTAWCVLTHTN